MGFSWTDMPRIVLSLKMCTENLHKRDAESGKKKAKNFCKDGYYSCQIASNSRLSLIVLNGSEGGFSPNDWQKPCDYDLKINS